RRIALAVGQRVQHPAQCVDAAQERVGHRGVEVELAVAQPHEQALERVRQRGDVLEPEEARRALDAVDRAEDLVQRLGVARAALLHLEQQRLGRLEVLERLGRELREQIRIGYHARDPRNSAHMESASQDRNRTRGYTMRWRRWRVWVLARRAGAGRTE